MERLGHREISQLLRKIEDVCLVKVEHVIKQAVVEGDSEALPPVARPPVGAVAVNHFHQMAFIPANKTGPPNGVWLVVKQLTFCLNFGKGS